MTVFSILKVSEYRLTISKLRRLQDELAFKKYIERTNAKKKRLKDRAAH
jgi:hypothetical protein